MMSLEGTWNLTQGSGIAIGGFIPLPLPAHGAVPVVFQYDTTSGTMYGAAADQSDGMVFTVAGDGLANVAERMTENGSAPPANELRPFCGSSGYPVLIGVRDYSGSYTGTHTSIVDTFCKVAAAVLPGHLTEDDCPELDGSADPEFAGDLDMQMTITLKFSSPSSASGNVHFVGQEQGYKAGAYAPITLSR